MSIIKEKIKLTIAFPKWPAYLKKIKKCKNRRIFLIGTPVHGNLGDHAIAKEAQYFFEDYFSDYSFFEILMPMYHTKKIYLKSIVNDNDIIVISGGGWMGNLWIHNENVIREIVKAYPNNKIVILPQTIYYTSDEDGMKELDKTKTIFKEHKRMTIFLREKKSYEFMQEHFILTGKSNIYLVPDMVLYDKNICSDFQKNNNNIVNLCIRQDCESQQNNIKKFIDYLANNYMVNYVNTVVKSPILLKNREEELKKCWNNFKKGSITITDRLHAMLFSILNGVPCIILNNKTGKVFGVSEWLIETKMVIKAKSFEEVTMKLKKLKELKINNYDRNMLLPYFEKMAMIIRKD